MFTGTPPNARLGGHGIVTSEFRALGIEDFADGAWYLQQLPYGRVSNRADLRLVLREGRGTCTTKHALLAKLAREQAIDVALTLGIYLMDEHNTPGVGRVLTRYGLAAIPEAHCYLTWQGRRIDITRDVEAAAPIGRLLHEERITPEQIGDYKIALHRRFMADWLATGGAPAWALDDLWRVREECIAELSEESPGDPTRARFPVIPSESQRGDGRSSMDAEIGGAAGVIWQYLDGHGETTLTRLKKDTKLSDQLLLMALGWLAREGKLTLTQDRRALKVRLHEH